MNYHTVIVDTEPLSRLYIRNTILEYIPHAILYDTDSLQDAGQYILNNKIDILFIEIKMPGKSGLEFVESLHERDFEVIFTTAYADYAIQAIRTQAFDYLLKPFKKTDFSNTIDRLFNKVHSRYNAVIKNTNSGGTTVDKIGITYQGGTKYISLNDIIYLEANNSYTVIYLTNNESITASKPINKFEERLIQQNFFRIHKSHIININHFTEYSSKNGDQAVMNNGTRLSISRYRLNDFLALIDGTIGKLKI